MRYTSVLQGLFKLRTVSYPVRHKLETSFEQVPFKPSSLLLFATPESTDYALQEVQELSDSHPSLQIVMAGTLSNHHPRSVVEIWLEDRVSIKHFTPHSDKPVGKRWDFVDSTLRLVWGSKTSVVLPVAKGMELRGPGILTCMFFVEKESEWSMLNLEKLTLEIPLDIEMSQHQSNLKKLNSGSYEVTNTDGNVLKSLDGESAAWILMDLMDQNAIQKTVDVYAKLYEVGPGGDVISTKTHKVIAGGGEWGASANILVLDSANFSSDVQTKLDFFVVDPDNAEMFEVDGLHFEQVHLGGSDYAPFGEEDTIIEDSAAIGSETGCVVDGVSYSSQFETVSFNVIRDSTRY